MKHDARSRAAAAPWWEGEQQVFLAQVPAHLPLRSNGKPYTESAIRRWVNCGAYGIRLRAFQATPHAKATTIEELQRFQQALTAMSEPQS